MSQKPDLEATLAQPHPLTGYQPVPLPSTSDVEELLHRVGCLRRLISPNLRRGTAQLEALSRLEKAQTSPSTSPASPEAALCETVLAVQPHLAAGRQHAGTGSTLQQTLRQLLVRRHPSATRVSRPPRRSAATPAAPPRPFSVQHPPPQVTEAEVDAYLRALSAADRKTLFNEFELTHVDGFDLISDGDGAGEGGDAAGDSAAPLPPAVMTELRQPTTGSFSDASSTASPNDSLPAVVVESIASRGSATPRSAIPPPCMVEVEYTGGNWLNAESTTSRAHAAPSDEGNGDPDVQSFGRFSRKVLADGERRLQEQQRHPADGEFDPHLPLPPPASPATEAAQTGAREGGASDAAHADLASSPPAQATRSDGQEAAVLEQAKTAFLRHRARDILMCNRVREADVEGITATVYGAARQEVRTAAASLSPALERLQVLLTEADTLLGGLTNMERGAIGNHVTDPAQFLLVPRYRAACSNLTCHAPFSAIVTRVVCGRCGQVYCPSCCRKRGVGPTIRTDGQAVSLGWEPLCDTCWRVCADSQRRIITERRLRRQLKDRDTTEEGSETAAPGRSTVTSGTTTAATTAAEVGLREDSEPPPAIENMTVKEAVLFGAYCDERKRLDDGFSPFYVITGQEDGATFWDILAYRFATAQSAVRSGWQGAGKLAVDAVNGASKLAVRRYRVSGENRSATPSPSGAEERVTTTELSARSATPPSPREP